MPLFRFSSAENRLLNAVRYTRRNAEINAANQNAQRQAQVAANQKLIEQNPAGLAPGQSNLAPPVTGVTKQPLNQTGFQTMHQSVVDGKLVQKTTVAPELGGIDQAALKRLMDSGMTEGQAREKITSLRPSVQQTMGTTGLPGGTAQKPAVLSPQESADKAESDVRERYRGSVAAGNSIDPANIERDVQTARANALKEAEVTQSQKTEQKTKEGANAAGTEASNLPPGMQAALQGLPAEYSFLAPIFETLLSSQNDGQSEFTKAMLEGGEVDVGGQKVKVQGIKGTFDAIDEKTEEMKAQSDKMFESIQGILDRQRERTEQELAQQKKAAQEQLEWNRLQEERRIKDAQIKAREEKIAELAVRNRMGGDGALREIDEARNYYENQLSELAINVGFARTDLAAKFSGLYLEASKHHDTQTISNIKDAQSALERISGQQMSNAIARNTAERDELGKLFKNQADARREYAANLRNVASDISSIIQFERNLDAQKIRTEEAARLAEEKETRAEQKAEEKETAALAKEDRARVDTAKKEKQKAIGRINDDLQSKEWYKRFHETGTAFRAALRSYQDFKDGIIPETTMQEVATMAYAKVLDSNSVVRIEEFKRAADGLGLEGLWQKVDDAITGGRGFPPGLMEGFMKVVENSYNEQRDTAMIEAGPLLRQIREFNIDYAETGIKIDPLSIFPADFLPVSDAAKNAADSLDEQAATPSSLLRDLALAHQRHEGYGTPGARTITAQNNPGALRWHPGQKAFGGEKGANGFTKFPDYQSGFAALMADIDAKVSGRSSHIDYASNPTVLDYISVYAPTADGNNPTSYASALVKELQSKGYEIYLDTPLSELIV